MRNETPTSTREMQEVMAATMMDRKKITATSELSTGMSTPIFANT